ncbi:MAG: sensor histidine kinase, partial [Steroidobacteraceae bacterium]
YAIGSLLNSHSEAARQWLAGFGSTDSGFLVPWLSNAVEYGVLYLSCVALVTGLLSYRSLMNERLLLSRVEATAAQERLRALRAQLNPHFLFNALNSIVCLNEFQAREAQRVLVQLSELLRRTLRASEREEHTLSQELAHLDAYLEIESSRHPARIDWRTRVAPGCGGAFVPSLLLLPLVENAVTHGLGDTERVAIDIDVQCTRRNLVLRITNNCRREGHRKPGCGGMGLRNVRERLHVSFGSHATMTVHRPMPDSYEARITLPLRLAGATASEPETLA